MVHLATEAASAPIGQDAAEEAAPLDLQQFCGTDPCRSYLMKPFSRDGFTWATDGHILVRVQLRPEIPDVDKKFSPQAVLAGIDDLKFCHPSFELPSAPTGIGQCDACEGRGHMHACPDCECECEACGGSGEMNPERQMSTSIGLKIFSLYYARQMLSLPDVEIAWPIEADEKPLLFRFDGGAGALMPMRSQRANHIDIKFSATDA